MSSPTPELQPGQCATCAADPRAAPRRWCAPLRCYCGHQACPAYVTGWLPRAPAQARPEPVPGSLGPLEAKVLRMAGRAAPERLAHTEKIRTAWDERDEPTWLDRL